jgi:succinyl-diaminopimelate desuccinylase
MMAEVRELLDELIRRPSVSPEDAGCQELIRERLTSAGFACESMRFGDSSNLWALHGEAGPIFCLSGHTDVVPPGPRGAWTADPFEPVEREGKLFGRGASDMKASVAALVVAAERIARQGHPGRVALLLTSDEETASLGTPGVLAVLAARGVRIAGAIVGEPTSEDRFGDAIKTGRRGSATGTLLVKGAQGHTAYPHLANNAVHRLAPALAELAAITWTPAVSPFPETSLQVSDVAAGTGAANVIPGECRITFNIRFGTSETPESLAERVGELFRRHGIEERIEWECSARPFLTEPGPLVEALEGAVREFAGVEPRRTAGGGTSDARWFAERGIPVAEFGPSNATIHAVDECVDLECLEPLAQVYERAVRHVLTG